MALDNFPENEEVLKLVVDLLIALAAFSEENSRRFGAAKLGQCLKNYTRRLQPNDKVLDPSLYLCLHKISIGFVYLYKYVCTYLWM